MFSFLRREWLPLLLALVPSLLLLIAWPSLPGRVPVHFNIEGKADGFADKGPILFLLPAMSLVVFGLLSFVRTIDPKKPEFSPRAMAQIKVGLMLLMALLSGYFTWVQLGGEARFSAHILVYLILASFLFLGNMMGKMRPNYFVGIRTPWTLEHESVWAKTHRLGGKIWVFGSLILMTFLWALPEKALAWVFLGVVLVGFAGVPVAASWWFSRQLSKNG